MRVAHVFYFSFLVIALAGCGLKVPEMRGLGNDKDAEKLDENIVVSQIKCELHKGVQDVLANPPVVGKSIDWLRDWGAKVTLTVTVDEKGAIAPGLTFNTVHPSAITKFANGNVTTSQSFALGFGLSGSADATRKEAIAFTYAFADLLKENPILHDCDHEAGILVHSDLKIEEFIANKAFVASIPGTTTSPYSTFSDEITFIVAYSANVTPSWKLLRFSGGSQGSSSLLSGMRTKTQDVILTLGPIDTKSSTAALVSDAQVVHQAALIGHAITTSLQGQ